MNSRAGRERKAKNVGFSRGTKSKSPDERPVLAILFVLVLVFVLAMLAHVFILEEKAPGSAISPINTTQDGCTPGLRLNCTNTLGCEGRKLCVEGKWTECVTQRICAPGQKGACSVNSCEMGYATCNSCGTAYENCTSASAPS
ncbi:MAG: hypothetical protein WC488_03850 [Candidatus Micrarchaeia archaeon]